MPLQRGGNSACNFLRGATGLPGLNLNDRKIHIGQVGYRQAAVTQKSPKEQGYTQQNGGDRPVNKNPADVHGTACPLGGEPVLAWRNLLHFCAHVSSVR